MMVKSVGCHAHVTGSYQPTDKNWEKIFKKNGTLYVKTEPRYVIRELFPKQSSTYFSGRVLT